MRKLRGWRMTTIKLCGAAFGVAVLVSCAWGMTRADRGVVADTFGVVDDLKVLRRYSLQSGSGLACSSSSGAGNMRSNGPRLRIRVRVRSTVNQSPRAGGSVGRWDGVPRGLQRLS